MATLCLISLPPGCSSSSSNPAPAPPGDAPAAEFTSPTLINNVVRDPRTGHLYAGAVNAVHQLDAALRPQSRADTGPRRDNRLCTPPVTSACSEARDTDNHNKLLLVHAAGDTLVECGSVFRGICSLRNLSRVEHLLYFSDTNGEKSYVASAEEAVSVVGVMSFYNDSSSNFSVFLVGKGYGSHDSTKLISTRILKPHGDWVVFDSIIEASSVQASSFVLRYLHDFRFVFKDGIYVYFLFSRTLGVQENKNFTFLARMCENDHSYYSYTELQLNCSRANTFNKVQAAYVSAPGEILARKMNVSATDQVLFITFSSDEDSSRSALCMYPLPTINKWLRDIIQACYSESGLINNKQAVYYPYTSKTEELCRVRGRKICGEEFLPSPLASTPEFALTTEPTLVRKGHVTAVAVALEMEHAVAFLGTATGEVLKVHLSAQTPEVYGRTAGEVTGDKVNKNLLFDRHLQHLYITTETKITKVAVQACHLKTDCHSCVSMRDPYCGWCVLKGRCTRKLQCERSEEANTWLWSPAQRCVRIESFNPASISCKKTDQVSLYLVPALPRLGALDVLHCVFGEVRSQAAMAGSLVTCSLPEPGKVPAPPPRQDYVSVPMRVMVNDTIEVTSGEYHFYDCGATVSKNPNTPCISCVTSKWGCQWDARKFNCSDRDDATSGSNQCPQFASPEPTLIPVGHRIPISFKGTNLGIYDGRRFHIGTELMKQTEEEVTLDQGSKFSFRGYEFAYNQQQEVNVSFHIKDQGTDQKIDSTLTVVLYNCSMGREDCSLCRHADETYQCVWCPGSKSCVYRELCRSEGPAQCPDPRITDIVPRYGPMNGRIAVTIKGSNLGIKKEDIKKITVAGVDCVHKMERYSVSTSLVCEVGPARRGGVPVGLPVDLNQGVVEVEVEGGRRGRSQVNFTYRDPIPTAVKPPQGPAAGGTVITITGTFLDTATKEDVSVTVGEAPCKVRSFGPQIECTTGKYGGPKLPSGLLTVTVRYGKNTTKEVRDAFTYLENPKVSDYYPKASFVCGGRVITVVGGGFAQIQNATMTVQPSADVTSPEAAAFVAEAFAQNDTMLQFRSPAATCCQEGGAASFRTALRLDNAGEELGDFLYHPDPTFSPLAKTVITETGFIIVSGRGFAKAMTAREARAFVGDTSCNITILQDDKLFLDVPSTQPRSRSTRHRRDTSSDLLDLVVQFGHRRWVVGAVSYARKDEVPLAIIIPAVLIPMLVFIGVSVYCYRRKSQQAEREYEKVKHQLENLEESVRDRCKKEFTDLMIEMEDHTNDVSEARIPFLDYKMYTDRNFFLTSQDDVMITGKLQIPEARRATVTQALNQFSNLLNSKTFLINFIKTLESKPDFNARARSYFASLLTVALHGKLEYYTDIMRTLLLELMDEHVHSKNPKLMLRRSETVVERMLCNWMSICLYQFLRDTAGEPLYKLFKALKHQVEKGPVDANVKKAKYTLNDTGLLGDDVEYLLLTLQVLVHGEGPDVTPVKVLNCDTITQVKEKIIDQVYRNQPYSQRPKSDSVALEWRPGSTGQILSDLDLTSQKEGRWKRLNTLAHYNVRDNATLVLSRVLHTQSFHQNQDSYEEKNALLEEDNTFHLVRPADEMDEGRSKRGSMKHKATNKAITEIYLTRLLSVKGTLQVFVDDFFSSVLSADLAVPPAVKYFFDFLDEQAHRHDNVDEETLHIWKTHSLPLRFWVNILKNPEFIFDVHVTEVVDASLHVIGQTFMDACTKTEHKLSRVRAARYAQRVERWREIMGNEGYYKGIRQMVPVSDQDMNTHLAEVSRQHTDKLNTQVALHQLYQYASKYYDGIIQSLDEDPAAQSKQLTLRLQQIAAALENKVTDL
uniref:Plexin b2a, tandem duplicate 1 n=1 Tax=Gadus morhua TaxID=8049 RepID=A0A8C5BVZ8_GADMO